MLTPVEGGSLAVAVAEKLRREILTGSIQPGERILEQSIAEGMKTSHGPVRDAFIQLEHEGLITRERNRGAIVTRMTAVDVEEIHSIRLALELLALRYVIEKAQPRDLERLQAAVESLRACLAGRHSLEEAVDLDVRFHEEFISLAGHRRLATIWQGIKPQIWFLIHSRSALAMKNLKQSITTHEDLLDAIRRKDIRGGRRIISEHLDTAYTGLIKAYTEKPPKA